MILEQPDLSVQLQEYAASYSRGASSGIEHEITIRNTTGLKLVAVEIGFVSFDPFDDFLHFGIGFARPNLEMGERKQLSWRWSPRNDFQFYTGIAFVYQLRFTNGEIYEADMQAIAKQILGTFGIDVPEDKLEPEGEGVLKI